MAAIEPLFYLHGFSGSGEEIHFLQASLGRDLVGIPMPGHGPEYSGESFSMQTVIDRVDEARQVSGLEEIDLLGYSMGGRAALTLAVEHPFWLRRLILVGARPGLRLQAEREARILSDEGLAQRIEERGVLWFADWWESQPIITSQSSIEPVFRAEMRRRRRAHTALGLANSLRFMGAGTMAPLWDGLKRLTFPILLVTGEKDRTYNRVSQAMLEELPDADHLRLRGAGHCAHFEEVEAFSLAATGFLSQAD